jgi:hypothetical protein
VAGAGQFNTSSGAFGVEDVGEETDPGGEFLFAAEGPLEWFMVWDCLSGSAAGPVWLWPESGRFHDHVPDLGVQVAHRGADDLPEFGDG